MQIYPNRFAEHLAKGLSQVYLVFGDEPQQKLDIINQLRDVAKSQGFDERQSLVADGQFQWSALLDAAQSLSLFSSRRLIELELPEAKPGREGSQMLTDLAAQADPDTLLVLHGPRAAKDVQNSKWFKALEKRGIYCPCYPLEGRQLNQWLAQQAQQLGVRIDANGIQSLADLSEGNLLAAKQEIEKLALLYPHQSVSQADVEKAVVDQSRFNVFQLVDVLLAGDAQKAVKMLYRLESEGIAENIVLWALTREWHTLTNLQFDLAQRQPIKWMQYRIFGNRQGLYQQALQRLSPKQLGDIEIALAKVDSLIKQGQIQRPFIALCHLCLLFIPMPIHPLELA